MKELIDDTLKVSASVKELLLAPTPYGQLQQMVRISRPNWSVSECFKAGRWMRRNGLNGRSAYSSDEQYLGQLGKLLLAYDKEFPVRGQYEVADEVSLSRWEARWARARSRQLHREEQNSIHAELVSSAA